MDYSKRLVSRLNYDKIIQMTAYTAFNNCGYNGYSRKVLLSGICKYYRRGLFDKFVWCISEMLLFGIHPNGKGLVTNVLNRLKILIMEELMFSSKVHRIVEAIQMVEDIDNKTMELDEVITRVYSLCKILKKHAKSRTVSYFRNWFRYEGEGGMADTYETTYCVFDQINTFKKKGDSEELLQLGENLLKVLDILCETSKIVVTEECMRNVMFLYRKFMNTNLVAGTRYRRKKGIYMFWEIMNDYMFRISVEDEHTHNDDLMRKWTIIYDFGLKQFFREQMTERDAFGVWMIMYCVFVRQIDWNGDVQTVDENLLDTGYMYAYLKQREHKVVKVDEDFVINDWHVNRAYGVDKFAKVGAFVKNEKRGVINQELFDKISKFYIVKKSEIAENIKTRKSKKQPKKKPINKLVENIIEKPTKPTEVVKATGGDKSVGKLMDLMYVNWDDNFSNVTIQHDGVCGGKVCCIFADFKGKRYVLKEMRKSFNYGRDYLFMDRVKKYFGIKSMNMHRIRSDKGLVKIDKTLRTYKNNCTIGDRSTDVCEGGTGIVYCIMDCFENIGSVVDNKDIRADRHVKKELLRIRLFDGLFRSSDNIPRNILVGTDKRTLLSIDEGDIYGKRKIIFNRKGDWDKNNMEVHMLDDILGEWDLETTLSIMKTKLTRYKFETHITEMENRFRNYREIVLNEI